MSRTEFFPYPVARGALSLACQPQDEHVELAGSGLVRAEGIPDSGTVGLSVSVAVEDGAFDRVLPEDERAEPPADVIVAVRSIQARERHALRLTPGDGDWHGTLELPKSRLYGEITLEPSVVRAAPGSDPAYAIHVGALLATGEPVKVEIDEPPASAGGVLDIRFDDFRDTPNPKRSANPQLLYLLDTEADPPVLWLNEGIEEFKPVMLAKGTRGYNVRIRDAMFETIVSQVWTTLAGIVFTNLALVIQQNREADDDSDPIESLPEWHQRVISFWAPHLSSGNRAEAIEQLVFAASDRTSLPDLFDGMTIAVQKWVGPDRAFRGLLRMRDREGV